MKTLTLHRMETKLFKSLDRTVIKLKPLQNAYAKINVARNPAPMTVDPFRGGLLEKVVHELIHLAYREELSRWGVFEEPIVRQLESVMADYINMSPKRTAKWRKRLMEVVE